MALIHEMFAYWRKPIFTQKRQVLDNEALRGLTMLLAFSLGGVFAIFIGLGILFQILEVEHPQTSAEMNKFMKSAAFPLIVIVLVPIIEEIVFRSWLGIKWGVMLIMPILLWGVAGVIFLKEKSLPPELDFAIMVGLSALIFVYIIHFCRTTSDAARQDRALQSIFPFIFWMTAFFFGALHLSNFESNDLGVLALFLTLPQIFIGAVLGFLRMRFSLLVAIAFHGSYNGVLILISLLAMQSVAAGEGALLSTLRACFRLAV